MTRNGTENNNNDYSGITNRGKTIFEPVTSQLLTSERYPKIGTYAAWKNKPIKAQVRYCLPITAAVALLKINRANSIGIQLVYYFPVLIDFPICISETSCNSHCLQTDHTWKLDNVSKSAPEPLEVRAAGSLPGNPVELFSRLSED